jgi:uncharacterized protein YbgA (DUF1722 family)
LTKNPLALISEKGLASKGLNNIIKKKNCWNVLIWVTGHCNREAVSRNRYGVEKTVDTHKILINAIQFYVCFQAI